MKQLSESLDAYYLGDYVTALSEVDKALEIYPELAISYARKGSIYYKMEDIKELSKDEKIKLYRQQYYQKNREKIYKVSLERYYKHKDVINKRRFEKHICDVCGYTYTNDKSNAHKKQKRHIKALDQL